MDVFGMDFGFSNELVYYHNNFHNFDHKSLTCQVVSGGKKFVNPCKFTISPLISRQVK